MSHTFTISAIGGSGPKATAINFTKTEDGIRLWAWMPNAVAGKLRPGMTITAEQIGFGATETTYEKAGVVTELKVPRRQLFLGGSIVVGKPESEPMEPMAISFADEAEAYAKAYDAKRTATPTADDGDKSF